MTILQRSTYISKALGVNLYIKRDDLYPFPGGGNKARKLYNIIPPAIDKGYNALVTTGSNQSNHVRAASIFAATVGWKSILVIHDKKPLEFKGNLKLTNFTGSELRFVQKKDVKEAMDLAMEDLKRQGSKPLYIWGGGHCTEGSFAFYEAVKELKNNSEKSDLTLLS